jgi:hypothetical protein
MKRSPFLGLAFLGLLLSAPTTTQAKVRIDPEIVRLSYVQGDVRFCRGDGKNPDLTKPWEQAEVNVPILKGYSLATGNGRTEIEFEYGSTVYLAENSVLLFQTLTTKDGVPSTEMELVAGTATVSFHPIPKEVFDLMTPTEQMQFVEPTLVRIDSYLDGATVTIHGDGWDDVTQGYLGSIISHQRGAPGQVGADHSGTPADWDAWVAARVKQRQVDTAAALRASGLTSFIPGLTDMYNGGTFFPCAPFGICWEPKELPDTTETPAAAQPNVAAGIVQPGAPSGTAQTSAPTGADQPGAPVTTAIAAAGSSQPVATQTQQEAPAPIAATVPNAGMTPYPKKHRPKFSTAYYPLDDCSSYQLRVVTTIDLFTGKKTVVEKTKIPAAGMWTWALCHSGAWVHLPRRGTQYTFVVHRKRHRPPVRWVHTDKGDGYVPKHPSDARGKPPLNLKYGVFVAQKGSEGTFERVAFSSAQKYKLLSEAPKEFRDVKYPQLAAAERPEIHGRLVADSFGSKPAPLAGIKSASASITYDYKTRKFIQAGAPMPERTSRPVVVGGLSARGGYSPSSGRGTIGGGRASGGGTQAGGGSRGGGAPHGSSSGGGHSSGGGSGRGGSRGGGGGGAGAGQAPTAPKH